jgi:hypothetical protein
MLGGDIDGETPGDYSGSSVSLSADGTVVAIGALYNDGSGNLLSNSGHVRIYKYNPNKTVAQMVQTLPGFGPAGWDRLGGDIDSEAFDIASGISVSLSADGTVVAIGANMNNGETNAAGRVRIYKYRAGKTEPQLSISDPTTTNNFGPAGWDRLGGDIDGQAADDKSGTSVSLSADGTVVAIGANLNNGAGGDSGQVRVYKYNSTKTTTPVKWEQLGADIYGQAQNDQSGTSVSLSADGTVVAIGAVYNDAGGTSTDNRGHVRVYKYTQGKAAVTVQTDPLFGPAGWTRLGADINGEDPEDRSGFSVSLSADGTVVAIGAILNDFNGNSNSGHVRVYKYTPDKAAVTVQTDLSFGPAGWTRLGADIDGELYNDYSGQSISLSADGTIVAIGAPYNDGSTGNVNDVRGQVRAYKYNAGKTAAITDQTLPNFGPAGWDRIGVDIDGEAAGDTSYYVSLSADGTTLAIGATANDGNGPQAGQVRVYKLDTFGAITYTSSNPTVADVYGNAILLIKEGVSGSTTITATQAATPPFTMTPITVQATLAVTGTTYTLQYNYLISTYTPFSTSALTVAYGRGGSQGTGVPRWIVGGSGTNVFAISSRPSATTAGTWSVVASGDAAAPFTICNSLGYSNGIWVAGNNTNATNVIARSIDGGTTWTPVTLSSVSGVIAGATAVGANAFCNYSLAYADYSNDTNLRSWVAVKGTKNFMFDGGVNTVATVSSNIVASAYNGTNRAWWVAGGKNQFVPQSGTLYIPTPGNASIAYTLDPAGAAAWTLGTSTFDNGGNGIIDLEEIRDVTFSPQTQRWLAVGVGSAAVPTRTVLYSDISGIAWTSAVVSSTDLSLNLNTCVWNQLDASVSSSGRWLVGGTRSGVDALAVSLFISNDVYGQNWTPIAGTGAILSQIYSLAYNGRVWIAAGTPATSNGSTSTLMRTTDPSGASGWQGIAATNVSTGGFDTAARSIAWNADQQMWISTGENTSAVESSIIYSLDVSGSTGTWRSVRESNSLCFSSEGTGIAFTGDKWFASGQGNNQIVATAGTSAASATTGSWTSIATHGTLLRSATDIAYTGRRLIATGASISGTSNGIILSTDNSGSSWSAASDIPGSGFTDSFGGATSITFEASYEGVGRAVATGRSATNTLSVSMDGGTKWADTTTPYLYENYGPITIPTYSVSGFPVLNQITNWMIDISFTTTNINVWRGLVGSMRNNIDTARGWGIWVSQNNGIHFSTSTETIDSFNGEVKINVPFNLNITKVGINVIIKLTNLLTNYVITNNITVTGAFGIGPVSIGGWPGSPQELFVGQIGYVLVKDVDTSKTLLFTTGGNSVAYVGNDTIFLGGGNDVQWTGKRWVATGRTSGGPTTAAVSSTVSGSAPLPDIINNNTSAVATSDDGITWQSVSSSQAPNLSEGTFLASNPRIGATPLINSQIAIADGGDTESTADYGGMVCTSGGSGTGVAQIDIIAELTPVSNAASSVVSGAVNILGAAGNGGANSVGNAPSASFDNTAFTITTRPL